MNILVLESSTTSAKAMFHDSELNETDVLTNAYVNMYDDITLHNPDEVFSQTIATAKRVINGRKVDIIAISGTWHSVLLCDKQMTPLTPVYLWSNTKASSISKVFRSDETYTDSYYHTTGCMVNAIYPFFKLQYLKNQGYSLQDCYIMGQGTYNFYKLTGERKTTLCMASGAGLLNIKAKKYDADLLNTLGINEEQLSAISDYRSTFPLKRDIANELGVSEGIPVLSANSDGGLNQIGSGALREGVMTFSVGTSGAIRLSSKMPVLPKKPSTWCYMSPTSYLSGAATNGCCNCIDWIKARLFDKSTTYMDIEEKLELNEDGPVFLPFIFGERCPGWEDEKRGGFLYVKPEHTKYDLYRAVQEGILFNLFQCYEELTSLNDVPDVIKLSGGIIKSKFWTQMCADVFKADMEVDDYEHSSLLGGVVLAKEVVGLIPDMKEFQSKPKYKVSPNPDRYMFYDTKYEKYKDFYKRI